MSNFLIHAEYRRGVEELDRVHIVIATGNIQREHAPGNPAWGEIVDFRTNVHARNLTKEYIRDQLIPMALRYFRDWNRARGGILLWNCSEAEIVRFKAVKRWP